MTLNKFLTLNKALKLYSNKKIFLITGHKTFKFLEKKKIHLKLKKLKYLNIYFKKESVPQYRELKTLIIECKKTNPDVIIGLGGGTVIDYAKLTRFFLHEQKIIFDANKILLNKKKLKKLICIPTTCGSGAESTTFSVLYKKNKKYSLNNQLMIPDFYSLIPEYLINMPKKIATPPALDVFAQTLESIMSLNSNKKSLKFSYKSLNILGKNIFKYLQTRNFHSTKEMAMAANFAGKAINISKTTGPHALSYIFTSKYGIPHGRAVFMSLKYFLQINYNGSSKNKSLQKKFKKIFSILKIKTFKELENIIDNLSKNYTINIYKIRHEIKSNPYIFVKSVNIERLKNNPIKINNKTLKEIINSI